MKITKLLAIGCSWTYGDGLIDPNLRDIDPELKSHYYQNTNHRLTHCYAGLVARHFGLELINTAQPGGSLESMRWTLMWYLHRHPMDDVMIVAGLTDAARQSWYDPNFQRGERDNEWTTHKHSTWINHQQEKDSWWELNRLWTALTLDGHWAQYNFQQTVNLFDQASSRHGIPVLQFSVLPNPYSSSVPTLLYSGTSWREILQQHAQRLGVQPFVSESNHHPNETGHKIIADHLIDHIKSCKIFE